MLEDFLAYLRSLGLVDLETSDPSDAVGEYKVYAGRVYVGPAGWFYNTTRPRALDYDPETQVWSWWDSDTNQHHQNEDPRHLLLRELQLQQTEQQAQVQYALEQMSLTDDLLHKLVDNQTNMM
jgi:hypothetical protein